MKNECCNNNHCWCKVSLAFAITVSLSVFLMGVLDVYSGYLPILAIGLTNLNPGYGVTIFATFIVAMWYFLGTFVFFSVVGFIYKLMKKCCNKCYCCNKTESGCCAKTDCSTEKK